MEGQGEPPNTRAALPLVAVPGAAATVPGGNRDRLSSLLLGRSPPSWPNGHTGPRSMRPDRGRPTLLWLVGPCGTAILTGWGPGHTVRGSPCCAAPHRYTATDLGLARVTGSFTTAATLTHPRTPPPPPLHHGRQLELGAHRR